MNRLKLLMLLFTLSVAGLAMANDNETQCHFKPHFEGSVELKGIGTGHWLKAENLRPVDQDLPAGGPGIDVLLGSRLKEWFFIGGGVSFNWWFNTEAKYLTPLSGSLDTHGFAYAIYAAPRFYIPVKSKKVSPFVDGGLGFCHFFRMVEGFNAYALDIYGHIGAGVDINRFNISAGYQYSYNHNGYLRVGYRF